MSDNLDIFEVDKILKRRIKGNKVEYLLKWAVTNTERAISTWEPTENLTGCPDLLDEFIHSAAHKIIAGKQCNDGTIEYLMKWGDGWKESPMKSTEVKSKWPILLLDFLESTLHFTKLLQDPNKSEKSVHFVVENERATGEPVEICYVTNAPKFQQELSYWTKYANDQYKFVDADEIRGKCPCLAIEYLESAFLTAPLGALPNCIDEQTSLACVRLQIMTRGSKSKLEAMDFKNDFKIKIIRQIDVEKILLFRNPGTIKNAKRRQSLATDLPLRSALKKKTLVECRRKSVSGQLVSTLDSTDSTPTSIDSHDSPPNMAPTSPTTSQIPISTDLSLVASYSTPKTTRNLPELVPLKLMLKQPKKAPFNVRRKSIDAAMVSSSTPSTSYATPSTSQLAKGTTTQIILSRILQKTEGNDWKRLSSIDQTLLQEPDFGKLRYSSSSDTD